MCDEEDFQRISNKTHHLFIESKQESTSVSYILGQFWPLDQILRSMHRTPSVFQVDQCGVDTFFPTGAVARGRRRDAP